MITTRQGRSGSVHGRRQPSQAALQTRLKVGCGANQFAGERPRGMWKEENGEEVKVVYSPKRAYARSSLCY